MKSFDRRAVWARTWPTILSSALFLLSPNLWGQPERFPLLGETVTVPNLVGYSITDAEYFLPKHGLKVGDVTHQVSGHAPGTVLGQDPAAGTVVPLGTAVDLVVAAKMVSISKAGHVVSLEWQAFGSGQYTVQCMDERGVWHDLPGTWPLTQTSWTGEDVAGITKRFYRVISH